MGGLACPLHHPTYAAYVAAVRCTASAAVSCGFTRGCNGGKGRNLLIEVAPDSGTGDLRGINDALAIAVRDDVHCYDFAYTLPAAH